ncbi:MAG: (2Fe-2S)-binding protein, partial [Candidatus Thermoplasmatota archaeon]
MRIEKHPILNFKREKEIYFYYNGEKIKAYEGETIASALYANGIKIFSRSKKGRARGFFCGIGKCSSCLMK